MSKLIAMVRQPLSAIGAASPRLRRLDRLVTHMIVNWALGALVGAVCASAALFFDPVGLRPLIAHSDTGAVAVILLYFGFMTTFGGVVCAAAIMAPPPDDGPPHGGLRARAVPALAYARVPARRVR